MKKIVCLRNVYHEGRFLSAGTDVGLPDDVARNWVERGLAKFVGEETPVNPPAVPPSQDNKEDAATREGAEDPARGSNAVTLESPTSSDISQDVPPDVPSEVKPEENSVVKQDFTTEIPKAEENAVIKENLTTEKMAIEETPAAVDDTPKRGRPPKKNHGGKRK